MKNMETTFWRRDANPLLIAVEEFPLGNNLEDWTQELSKKLQKRIEYYFELAEPGTKEQLKSLCRSTQGPALLNIELDGDFSFASELFLNQKVYMIIVGSMNQIERFKSTHSQVINNFDSYRLINPRIEIKHKMNRLFE